MTSPSLHLGEVQFYWRMSTSPPEAGNVVPAFLPFSFSFDPALQLVIQQRNQIVLNWLDRVYQEDANVGYLQEGHALSASYGDEFVRFIEEVIASRSPRPRKVVDIGCGGVYLLKRLKEKNYEVMGIDPSPVTVQQAALLGIPVIPEFYPVQNASVQADLIYHHDVLEHVADPVSFLMAHKNDLNPGGCVIIAVPDCTENIQYGDISMLLHEHLNYFDVESLGHTVRSAGYRIISLERGRYGGVLYCAIEPVKNMGTIAMEPDFSKFEAFRTKATNVIGRFRDMVVPIVRNGDRQLGIYVPLRAIPYLSVMKIHSGVRFFDDDPGIHRKVFDGFEVPVEDSEDLKRAPVQTLLIASLAFGDSIREKIQSSMAQHSKIVLWRNLLESDELES